MIEIIHTSKRETLTAVIKCRIPREGCIKDKVL